MTIRVYDTTLRDGTQAEEINYTAADKLRIAQKLDWLGIHYVEGGWPGSNPRDLEFFELIAKSPLKKAKLCAFGSTCRVGQGPEQDQIFQKLLAAETPVVTIFGKSWDLHVLEALRITLEQNLDIIETSVRYLKTRRDEVIYDAEHFFDGFRADSDYALKTLEAAVAGGADVLALCDTNGGMLPGQITDTIKAVKARLGADVKLGIHCHNDGELAVANSLAAVGEGAVQVQGTMNGYGERCGNANLVSIIPNVVLKMGKECLPTDDLQHLREVSRFIDELANRPHSRRQPYVGDSAFAHKGGVHVSAVERNPTTYEHIEPEQVGNRRRILVSDLSGRSNVIAKAREFGVELDEKDPTAKEVLDELKHLENQGFLYEGAEASFEILLKKRIGKHRKFFDLHGFRVIDEKRSEGEDPIAEATIMLSVDGVVEHTAAIGNGPVNALDSALRKALEKFYPAIRAVHLTDFKVRVLTGGGTGSRVRVLIESSDGVERWGTVGVDENIIQASYAALVDSIEYKLLRDEQITA